MKTIIRTYNLYYFLKFKSQMKYYISSLNHIYDETPPI